VCSNPGEGQDLVDIHLQVFELEGPKQQPAPLFKRFVLAFHACLQI
jgi:hypothetical protein